MFPVATGRQVRGSSHERAWVGSEASGFQGRAGDVVSEVAEAQSRGTEMLMATIDRLGRPVARAGTIEVGQGVDSSTLEGLCETGELWQFPISSAGRSPVQGAVGLEPSGPQGRSRRLVSCPVSNKSSNSIRATGPQC